LRNVVEGAVMITGKNRDDPTGRLYV